MTTGAAYDVSQSFGWRHGLRRKSLEASKFYGAIVVFTVIATCMNFFGINPIKALVYAGIVQSFTTPFLTLIVMLITKNPRIIGTSVNSQVNECTGLGQNRGDVRSHDRTPSHPTQVICWKTT